MDRIFGDWFSFDGFTVWKLHTAWDYLFFFLTAACGVVAVIIAVKFLSKYRNHTDAVKRVAKRMKKLGGKGAECYIGKTVHSKKDACPCDLICAVQDKVYVVQVYHFGLEVVGGEREREWKFRYNKEERTAPNPLPDLTEQRVVLTRLFSRCGIRDVPIEPLIVFADNYGTTKFYLPGVKCAVSYSFLKKWRKDRPLSGETYDLKAVKAALESSFEEPKIAKPES